MTKFLPARPLSLKKGYVLRHSLGALGCALGAAAIFFFAGRWVLGEAEDIQKMDRIWETGVPAQSADAEGEERSNHFIFYSYNLKVKYRDIEGKDHSAEAEFSSVWTEAKTSSPLVVRYDPKAPNDFALSWAIELGGARWASFGVSVFGLTMIVGVLGIIAWALRRQVVEAKQCAEGSDEVLLDVLSVAPQIVNGQATGATIYRYEMRGGEPFTGELVLPAKATPPLFADKAEKQMIALISPRAARRPLLIRQDLHPFDLSYEENAAIQRRIKASWPSEGA